MDDKKASEFRNRLINDESFRAEFAQSPRETLNAMGIEVPENVEMPAMAQDELDRRVASIKENISGDAFEAMIAGQELSDAQLEVAAGGADQALKSVSVWASIDV